MQNSIVREFENHPKVEVAVFDEGGDHGETLDWVQFWWERVALRGGIIWDEDGSVGGNLYGQPSTGLPFGRGFIIDPDGIVDTPYFGHRPKAAIDRIYELLAAAPCEALEVTDSVSPSSLFVGDVDSGSVSLRNCSSDPIAARLDWDCEWLELAPDQLVIPAQTTVDLALDLNARNLIPGGYTCPITVSFHDTSTVRVSIDLEVESPLAIEVVEDPTSARRGEVLRWRLAVHNRSDTSRAADAWFDAYLLNGSPHPLNPIIGPLAGTIPPGATETYWLAVAIPAGAPIGGPYRICNQLGSHPALWDSDCFELEIRP